MSLSLAAPTVSGPQPDAGSRRAEPARLTSFDDWRWNLPERRRVLLRAWLAAIAVCTVLVLALGGITRLTHSGLSIVDWQPLVGIVPPLDDQQWEQTFARYRQFPEYRQLRRGMDLEEFKGIFLWEYAHRLAARLIGVVFAVPFVWFSMRGYLAPPLLRRVLVLFGLGALQGLVGWLMVKSGLVERPSVSHLRLAAHLGLAFGIFGYSVWLIQELKYDGPRRAGRVAPGRGPGRGVRAVGVLLAAQIVWGAFVAGLKAGLIFNTFPLMAGGLVPPRGPDPGLLLDFVRNPAAVQWTHRVLGTVLLGGVIWLWLRARRDGSDPRSRRLAAALALLAGAQYVLGVLTLLYVVPLTLAVVHQLLAVVVFGVWVSWFHHVRQGGITTARSRAPRH